MNHSQKLTLNLGLQALVLALTCMAGWGQTTSDSSSSSSSSKAQQVPLSSRSQSGGSVQSQQSSAGSGGSSSVNTINSTVQVSGSYQGSVSGQATDGVLKLTVAEAVRRGLLYNLGTVGASASLKRARGQRLSSLSQMLPNIYGSLAEKAAKTSLQAEGFTASLFSGLAGGSGGGSSSFSLPTTVGPYHYYSAQANAEESVSFTSLYNLRTANASLQAAEFDGAEARELVVLAVGGTYLRLLASKANVMAEEGQTKQAEESSKQTTAEFDAGVKTVIDNNKSLIQFRTEQQRLSSLRSDLKKQTMLFARMIGLPSGQKIEFQEDLPAEVPDAQTLEEAIQQATYERADLKASRQQLQAATDARRAAKSEYLPSLSVKGYYGLQGVNPTTGVGVFDASATLTIPIFSSGRNHADVIQADASVSQRQAEYDDQRGLIELDVRQSYEDLQVAREQLEVSRQNRDLATETLQQSLDRYQAGVTDSVEVVQSQETVDSANRDYVSSLFSLNLARISLAKATGQAEKFIPNMLVKGN